MKKKLLALLLMLALVLSLFAACGEKADKKEAPKEAEAEEEAPSFAKGFYAVLDADGETVAYLHCTGKKLTVYDADGAELMEGTKFKWDEEEESFVIDGTAAFNVEISKKTTAFTVPKKSPTGLEKGSYTLEEIEEEDIPVPAVDPVPSPAVNQDHVPLPEGSYEIKYEGFSLGYCTFDGQELLLYTDEFEPVSSYLTYDAATGCYADETDAVCYFKEVPGGFSMIQESFDFVYELYPVDSLPYGDDDAADMRLPAGSYMVMYWGEIKSYVSFDGHEMITYHEGDAPDSSYYTYDPSTGAYTTDTGDVIRFEKIEHSYPEGYNMKAEGSDMKLGLYAVDTIPDSYLSGPPAFEFGTPTSQDELIPLCRFDGWVLWNKIPAFFIPGWGSAMYDEDEYYSEFNSASQDDDRNITGIFTVTMSGSYGKDGDLIDSIITTSYDVNEENTVYDTLAGDDGCILIGDTGDLVIRARCHDLYNDDGSFETNLIMIADNGEVSVTIISTAFAHNEDDWIEIADVIFELITDFQLRRG